jgi:AbiV family abortive infection protein
MGHRVLKFLQVEDLYDATLSNAFFLGQDAIVLLESGSVGRARALAVLSLEECGKAIMLHEAKVRSFALELPNPVLDDSFWKDWKTHLPKLRHVREFLIQNKYWFDVRPPGPNEFVLGPVDEYLAELDRFAADGDTSKLRGLYVDVDPATGKVVSPADEASAEDVSELLRMAHQIGWQLRLGDHIEFIASQRDTNRKSSPYSDYADGGPLARSRGDRGWEAQDVELMLMMSAISDKPHDA